MSNQMSPPQRPAQVPPPRPYSPYPNAQSPNNGIALPAAKRQRLSPNPSSPQTVQYSTPHHEYPTYPPNPYQPQTPAAHSPAASPPSFNMPQPYSPSPVQSGPGAMGPPPKPEPKEEKEKITDISDISDVIFGSGVDLREEENYIANTYRNTHGTPSYNQSFESGSTTASPNNSFNYLFQGNYGSHSSFSGSGSLSQPAASQESIEQEINRKHKAAAHEFAEKGQHHLRDPFLFGENMRRRLHQLAYEQGVALNIQGLFDPKPPAAPQGITGVRAVGPDGTNMAMIKAKPIVEEGAPFAEVLALISLAANERMRGILDEAYTLARNRRFSEPPDATAALPETLNRLQLEDQQREAERLRRRALRAANTPAGDGIKAEITSEAATPDPTAPTAPDKPLTKKERERQAKMGQTEEVLHKNANTTAAMQLGLGRKGKKYSWMTGGAAAPSNPYKPSTKPAAASTPAPTTGAQKAIGQGTSVENRVVERKWGGWSEAGVEGRGVQIRDLVLVLDRDGKERKALQKCLLKLE